MVAAAALVHFVGPLENGSHGKVDAAPACQATRKMVAECDKEKKGPPPCKSVGCKKKLQKPVGGKAKKNKKPWEPPLGALMPGLENSTAAAYLEGYPGPVTGPGPCDSRGTEKDPEETRLF